MLLVVGANGQLGTELQAQLGNRAEYVDVAEIDISCEDAVRALFARREYDAVINCAAYTAVDKAEDEPARADAVNHLGPLYLARYGRRVVHISTDYVFSGESSRPYVETDAARPLSVYGRSKLAGENACLDAAASAVVIRSSWLYSPHGGNFFKTMRRLATGDRPLRVVFDQIGTPTYAGHLAAAIITVLPQLRDGCHELYHYSNEGVCSWYDFAVTIMAQCSLPCRVEPIRSWDYPTRAQRPSFSVLDKTKFKKAFAVTIPHWQEGLRECIQACR
ncbi:MAG: dTDP-4-dehydrorhamnose reductase [Lentisphaeria bacterium]|jgi:dTDP-4-dehydrorhamnose reductase